MLLLGIGDCGGDALHLSGTGGRAGTGGMAFKLKTYASVIPCLQQRPTPKGSITSQDSITNWDKNGQIYEPPLLHTQGVIPGYLSEINQ